MKKKVYTQQKCKFEQDIGYIKATVKGLDKRINGSIEAIKDHIKQGYTWRATIIGIMVAVVLEVIAFAYTYGILSKTVNTNEKIIQGLVSEKVTTD